MSSSRDLISEYGLRPNKALGQNFLTDGAAIEHIVSLASSPGLPLLEIGPGLGALTFPLAETGLPLAAVEIDSVLAGILEKELPDNVRVINRDFLKADLEEIASGLGGGALTVVGNLPYYVTSPIAARILTSGLSVSRMVLMVQKEAADRFTAKPKDRNYGPLSVMTDVSFSVSPVFELSPSSYYPQPEVTSSVLLFESKSEPMPEGLVPLLKTAFSMRRKTLANNLAASGIAKTRAEELLISMGLSPGVRAEELSSSRFVELNALIRSAF